MQWASDAETVKGLNDLLYRESARLTQEFAGKGRKTVILKGQANARLYPDKYVRQPGDIDIWVEGGRESVLALLPNHTKTLSYAVHLPNDNRYVTVDVHFRPSSGNFNPITDRRLQRWLEREILYTTAVAEGFNVPSVRFALVMQLAHIQHHFLARGIGLRQICDYFLLLRNASESDRREVSSQLKRYGLHHTADALMWVLEEVLKLEPAEMIGFPDSFRGEWMLREIMAGGNFGRNAERHRQGLLRQVLESRCRSIRLMRFSFGEVFWKEAKYWMNIVRTLPTRIRYRTLSLRDLPG